MCERGASDLHLCVGMPPLVRKDGEIQPLEPDAASADAGKRRGDLLEPIMPAKNRDEFGRRHDTDFAYEISGLARFRANVFMDRKGRGARVPRDSVEDSDGGGSRVSRRTSSRCAG